MKKKIVKTLIGIAFVLGLFSTTQVYAGDFSGVCGQEENASIPPFLEKDQKQDRIIAYLYNDPAVSKNKAGFVVTTFRDKNNFNFASSNDPAITNNTTIEKIKELNEENSELELGAFDFTGPALKEYLKFCEATHQPWYESYTQLQFIRGKLHEPKANVRYLVPQQEYKSKEFKAQKLAEVAQIKAQYKAFKFNCFMNNAKRTAMNMATKNYVVPSDAVGTSSVYTPEHQQYEAVHDRVLPGDPYYASCDRYVSTVMRAIFDKNFGYAGAEEVKDYARNHYQAAEPDPNKNQILVCGAPWEHVLLYLGRTELGDNTYCEASYDDYLPYCANRTLSYETSCWDPTKPLN